MKTLSLTVVLAITLFLAASSASAQIVVDHFANTLTFTLSTTGATPGPAIQTDNYNSLTNQLAMGPGSSRKEMLTQNVFDSGNTGNGSTFVHYTFADTDVDISNQVRCSSDLVLSYLFGGTNFTAGGQNGLQILWTAANLAGQTAILTVTDNLGHESQLTEVTAATANFTQTFLYSNFTGVIGTANFADLTGISLQINSTAESDFELDALETVPEPATMSLLGLGLVGLIARRRRAGK